MAMAKPKKEQQNRVHFEMEENMMVIAVDSLKGELHMMIDTGSNISTMDKGRKYQKEIEVAGIKVRIQPTTTPVFAQFNELRQRQGKSTLDGILGQDFLARFSSVDIDYTRQQIIFER